MPTSLKLRLILASLLWVSVGIAVAALIVSAAFREHLARQIQSEIAVDLDELHRISSVAPDGSVTLNRPLADPRYSNPDSGYFWIVRGNGRVLAASPPLAADRFVTPPDLVLDGSLHYHQIETASGRVMLAERSFADAVVGTLHFSVGTDRRNLKRSMRQFNATLLWSMGAFAVSMILLAILLLLYAMRPLTQVQTALGDVRAGRANRLDGDFPGEVRPLVDDLNAMMEAMGRTTQKARAEAGNLAHSLKTPLAVLTDEAYAIEKAGLKGSADVLFDQCRRMQRQIDYQLARTRSAALRVVPGTATRAADVVGAVTSALSRLYASSSVIVENRVPADLTIAVDKQDANEIVANVLDNALKHASGRVTVSGELLARPGAAPMARLVIEDDGPGLPPEAWDVVFDIGERWDSRAKGTGLGLPIVRDLVRLYGGYIELGQAAIGGLRVTITLPAVGEGAAC